MDAVAPVLVGEADDAAAPHRGVLLQRRLDLGRVDVGAPRQDHVLEPVAEVEVAVLVEVAAVAEGLPAPLPPAGLRAHVVVGGPVAPAAHPHLALGAGRHRIAGGVADHDLAAHRPPDRAAVLQPLLAGDDGGDLPLGAGVQLDDALGAEPADPGLLQPHRARLGQVPHRAQRVEVVALAHRDRQPPDALHHRGDQVDDLGAVGLDGGQGALGVEPGQDRHVAAPQQRLARPHDRAVVVERPRHDEAAAGLQAQRHRALGVEQAALAGHDQLGAARRAARRRRLPRRGHGVGQRPGGGRRVGRRGGSPAGRQGRSPATPASTPMTTAGSASSTMARSSGAGRWAPTGWGTAPSFHAAAMATNHSTEFGSAIVTMAPSVTPRAARSRASATAASSSSRRVSRASPHDTAGRSGSASARSVRRRENETRVTASLWQTPAPAGPGQPPSRSMRMSRIPPSSAGGAVVVGEAGRVVDVGAGTVVRCRCRRSSTCPRCRPPGRQRPPEPRARPRGPASRWRDPAASAPVVGAPGDAGVVPGPPGTAAGVAAPAVLAGLRARGRGPGGVGVGRRGARDVRRLGGVDGRERPDAQPDEERRRPDGQHDPGPPARAPRRHRDRAAHGPQEIDECPHPVIMLRQPRRPHTARATTASTLVTY